MNILIKAIFFIFPLLAYPGVLTFEEKFETPVFEDNGQETSVFVKESENFPEPGFPLVPMRIFEKEVTGTVSSVRFSVLESQEYRLQNHISVAEIPFSDNRKGADVQPADLKTGYPIQNLEGLSFQQQKRGKTNLLVFRFYPCLYKEGSYTHFKSVRFEVLTEDGNVSKLIVPPQESKLLPGTWDYVILTTSSFVSAGIEFGPERLLQYRATQGFLTNMVTVDWIYSNYPGADCQMKIREFCKDAYLNWGMKFLCILGGAQQVPARNFYAVFSFENAEFPQDQCYYGNLDGNFDYNQNSLFGEEKDGEGGGSCDWYAEVYVGRLPAWNLIEVGNMIRKTIQREEDLVYDKFMFCGEIIESGISSSNNMSYLLSNQTLVFGSLGITNRFGTSVRYDHYYPMLEGIQEATAIQQINSGYSLISHIGHGSERSGYGISQYNVNDNTFTNERQALFYSVACLIGAFDKQEEIQTKCWVEKMLACSNGLWGCVGNVRDGWYTSSGPHYSMLYMRRFYDDMLRETSPYIGEVFNLSKQKTVGAFSPYYSYLHFCFLSTCLFADPAALLFPGVSTVVPQIQDLNTDSGLSFSVSPKGLVKTVDIKRFNLDYPSTRNFNTVSVTNEGNAKYSVRLTSVSGIHTNFSVWSLSDSNRHYFCEWKGTETNPPPYLLEIFTEPSEVFNNAMLFHKDTNQTLFSGIPICFSNNQDSTILEFNPQAWDFDYYISGISESQTNTVIRRYSLAEGRGGNNLYMSVSNHGSFATDSITITNYGNMGFSGSICYDFLEDGQGIPAMTGISTDYVLNTSCYITNISLTRKSTISISISGISETNGYSVVAVSGTNSFGFHSFTNVSRKSVFDFIETRGLRPFTFKIIPDVRGSVLREMEISDIRMPNGHVSDTKNTLSLSPFEGKKIVFVYFPSFSKTDRMKTKIRFLFEDTKKTETNYYWHTNY